MREDKPKIPSSPKDSVLMQDIKPSIKERAVSLCTRIENLSQDRGRRPPWRFSSIKEQLENLIEMKEGPKVNNPEKMIHELEKEVESLENE